MAHFCCVIMRPHHWARPLNMPHPDYHVPYPIFLKKRPFPTIFTSELQFCRLSHQWSPTNHGHAHHGQFCESMAAFCTFTQLLALAWVEFPLTRTLTHSLWLEEDIFPLPILHLLLIIFEWPGWSNMSKHTTAHLLFGTPLTSLLELSRGALHSSVPSLGTREPCWSHSIHASILCTMLLFPCVHQWIFHNLSTLNTLGLLSTSAPL